MKVFVVEWSNGDDFEVYGVFSCRAAADGFCRNWATAKLKLAGENPVMAYRVGFLIETFLDVLEFDLDTIPNGITPDGINLHTLLPKGPNA